MVGRVRMVARTWTVVLVVLAWPVVASAQVATLRVTVVDPTNAVIVGAKVVVTPASSATSPRAAQPLALDTGARGDALFSLLEPGRYTIHAESPGFEPSTARDVRVRAGENSRTVKLALAKLS